jgi:hypothetical protein
MSAEPVSNVSVFPVLIVSVAVVVEVWFKWPSVMSVPRVTVGDVLDPVKFAVSPASFGNPLFPTQLEG